MLYTSHEAKDERIRCRSSGADAAFQVSRGRARRGHGWDECGASTWVSTRGGESALTLAGTWRRLPQPTPTRENAEHHGSTGHRHADVVPSGAVRPAVEFGFSMSSLLLAPAVSSRHHSFVHCHSTLHTSPSSLFLTICIADEHDSRGNDPDTADQRYEDRPDQREAPRRARLRRGERILSAGTQSHAAVSHPDPARLGAVASLHASASASHLLNR